MRVWFPAFLVFLIVLVSGCIEPTHEELVSCSADEDCTCGLILGTEQCYIGNRAYIQPSSVCFRLCFGDDDRASRCINGRCDWVRIRPEEPDFPVADITYGEIGEQDNLTEITVRNTGPVAFLPILNLTITRDNESVCSIETEYDTIEPGTTQTKQIPIPPREEPGEWLYSMDLMDGEGRMINQSSILRVKLPEPVAEAHMYYTIKSSYPVLNNLTIGVRNTGNLTFTPTVKMVIQKGDTAAYIDTKIFPSLDPGGNETGNFVLPTLDNTTYYFEFVLRDRGREREIDGVKFEIKIGP